MGRAAPLRDVPPWLERKGDEAPEYLHLERAGLRSWHDEESAASLRVFGLLVDGEPAGVSVVQSMWDDTWMSLVLKTDAGIPGATAYLRRHVARAALRELGPSGVLNVQQDDGSLALRRAKLSYGPLRLEPKFSVRVREERTC